MRLPRLVGGVWSHSDQAASYARRDFGEELVALVGGYTDTDEERTETIASTTLQAERDIHWLTPEETRQVFDTQAREVMAMSGEEFIRRWDAGEFRDIADDGERPEIMRLAMLIPFGRQDGRGGRQARVSSDAAGSVLCDQ